MSIFLHELQVRSSNCSKFLYFVTALQSFCPVKEENLPETGRQVGGRGGPGRPPPLRVGAQTERGAASPCNAPPHEEEPGNAREQDKAARE